MNGFVFDVWTVWGLVAQGFFFSRFVVQWYASERQGMITVPHVFWILSLIGSVMITIYAISRADIVFLLAGALQLIFFTRSFMISRKQHVSSKLKRTAD
jgi:lipid-A-disaccharide synthase-like uncharacterized protein